MYNIATHLAHNFESAYLLPGETTEDWFSRTVSDYLEVQSGIIPQGTNSEYFSSQLQEIRALPETTDSPLYNSKP